MEATTVNPNHQPTTVNPEQDLPKAERDYESVYNLSAIEGLRDVQRVAYDTAFNDAIESGAPRLTAKMAGLNAINETISTYTEQHGFDSDDNVTPSVVFDLRNMSVDSISEEEWGIQKNGAQAHHGGYQLVSQAYEDQTGETYNAFATSNEEVEVPMSNVSEGEDLIDLSDNDTSSSEFESEGEKLAETRSKLAQLNAKRQGRLWTGKRAKAEYAELQDEYNKQIQELGKRELADTLEDESLTDLEKNAKVIEFLFDQQAKLREESKEAFEKTLVSKGVEWMNSGTRLQRFGKTAIIAAGAAGAGALIGVAAGAVGAAAAGAGLAATVTAGVRFARGYARSDAKKGRGLASLDRDEHTKVALEHVDGEDARVEEEHKALIEEQRASELPQFGSEPVEPAEVAKPEARDSFTLGQEYFDTALELDTQAEQKKRRRAVAIGATVLAVGSGVGIALHAASDLYDATAGAAPTPIEAPAPVGPGVESPLTDAFTADAPEVNPATEVSDEMREMLEQQEGSEADYTAESTHMMETTYDPSFNIEVGEGGIGFFQSVGLSESDWYAAAPELAEKFPSEFYNDGGDVRIMNAGSLSLEAQNYIKTRFGFFG